MITRYGESPATTEETMEKEREQFDLDEKQATVNAAAVVRERGDDDLANAMLRYVAIGFPTADEVIAFGAEVDAHLADLGVPVEPPRVA